MARSSVIRLGRSHSVFWWCLSVPFSLPRRLKKKNKGQLNRNSYFGYFYLHIYLLWSSQIWLIMSPSDGFEVHRKKTPTHFLAWKTLLNPSHCIFLVSLPIAPLRLNYIWLLGTLMHPNTTCLCISCLVAAMPFCKLSPLSSPAGTPLGETPPVGELVLAHQLYKNSHQFPYYNVIWWYGYFLLTLSFALLDSELPSRYLSLFFFEILAYSRGSMNICWIEWNGMEWNYILKKRWRT